MDTNFERQLRSLFFYDPMTCFILYIL